MKHLYGHSMLLAFCMGLSLVSLALASRTHEESALPRVVATVTFLDPRGLATLRTGDGTIYQVVQGTGWRVGTTVEWERYDTRTLFDQVELDCGKVS